MFSLHLVGILVLIGIRTVDWSWISSISVILTTSVFAPLTPARYCDMHLTSTHFETREILSEVLSHYAGDRGEHLCT